MKATNKSFFTDFEVKRIPIPEKYHEPQNDHERYVWQSQDGRVVKIKEFDDYHLMNTFKMLVNTILYAKEMDKHKALTSAMRRTATACHYHLQYIGYELYLRQYPNKVDKYQMIQDGDTTEPDEDWS